MNAITCNKVVFEDKKAAYKRAVEINLENRKLNVSIVLRAYRCPNCAKYHLYKMDKITAKWINDVEYRNSIREIKFVQRETANYNYRNRIKE